MDQKLPVRSLRRNASALGLLAGFLAPAQAQAQAIPSNKMLQASIRQSFLYSTNPLMVTDGATSLWGSTTSPELTLKSVTPVSEISLTGKIDQNFFNQSVFNTTDFYAKGGYSRKSERWQLSIQGAGDYDSTRTSELTNYRLRPGISRHLGLSATPTLTYTPTQIDLISLTGTVHKSQYRLRDYTNYVTYTFSPSYTHQFDPLNAGVITVQARGYKATRGNGTKVLSFSPTIGWQRTFSERFKASIAVGGQVSRQFYYGVPVDKWKPQYVFSGSLTFKGLQDDINVAVSRSQAAYGNGAEALQTSVSISDIHQISPVLSLTGAVSYLTSDYQRTSSGDLESLADGHGGITYRLGKYVDITADYRYRYETLTNTSKTASDSTFMLGLVYRPEAWALGE